MHPAMSATLSIALAALALPASRTASAAGTLGDPLAIAQGTAGVDALPAGAGASMPVQTLSFLQGASHPFSLSDINGLGPTFRLQQPVNALGIETGDRDACCVASSPTIALDGSATVPELPTLALWLAGLLSLMHLHRRRGPARQPRWNGLQRLD